MRHVEFSPDAEWRRTDLPLGRRLEIDRAIRAIAERPGLGSSLGVVRSADTGNANLIADLSVTDYAIVWLIRSADDIVWVEYVGPVVRIAAAKSDRGVEVLPARSSA